VYYGRRAMKKDERGPNKKETRREEKVQSMSTGEA
jgi:hypothetical protein